MRFLWNAAVEAITGDKAVAGLQYRDLVSGRQALLPCAGVFVAIGRQPETTLLAGQLPDTVRVAPSLADRDPYQYL